MEAPSPLSRFAMFMLLGSLVLILALWIVLKYLPAPPKGKPAEKVHPVATP